MRFFYFSQLLYFFTSIISVYAFSGGMSPYSKDSFVTKDGVVAKVESSSFNPVMGQTGLHLKMRTSSGMYIVHVAPQWYIDNEEITFNVGDNITVSGSEFYANKGKIAGRNIYAATIVSPSLSTPLEVRDPDTGEGLWSGRNENSDMTEDEKEEFRSKMREKIMKQMRGSGRRVPGGR